MATNSVSGKDRIRNNHIGTLRKYARLTLKETAHLVQFYTGNQIDFTTVSKHQSGERTPDEATIHAYARIFKVPVFALYADLTPADQLVKVMKENTDYNFDSELMDFASNH